MLRSQVSQYGIALNSLGACAATKLRAGPSGLAISLQVPSPPHLFVHLALKETKWIEWAAPLRPARGRRGCA